MHLRARADAVSVGSTHKALAECASLQVISEIWLQLQCAVALQGALYEADTLKQQTMHKCDHVKFFFFLLRGGGRAINHQTAIFVAASPGWEKNVSGYVCNHGSPSRERDTASPRGRYGERPQRDSVWRYICKNTTCWPATAHDVTTGVPQYKCRRENTSSASSSEACVRSMARSLGDAVSRSLLGEPWLHT